MTDTARRRSPVVIATVAVAVVALVLGAAIVGGYLGGAGDQRPPETQGAFTAEPVPVVEPSAPLEAAIAAATEVSPSSTATIAVASAQRTVVAGDDSPFPAWSTIKVPIAIAALRQDPAQMTNASAAITYSDNAAAAAMFDALPAGAVDAVLAEAGVPVAVNTAVVRPGFSAFGQTALSTSQQAVMASNLRCVAGSGDVVGLMGQIVGDQSYGLGTLPGARFKGGWGPGVDGGYQLRQFGLVEGPHGDIAIAMTAIPASGAYADGQVILNAMAAAIADRLPELPTSEC